MATVGDNSLDGDLLNETVQRVEKLIEERKGLNEHIKALLDTAEGQGLDKKTIREMIRLRAMEENERQERETLRDLYLSSLGLF